MKKALVLILTLASMVACKTNSNTENTEEIQNGLLETGCYTYNQNGDNIKIEITEVGENVKGNLNFNYKEKDTNNGTIVGKLNGDKLICTYTFKSEGIESTREVAFLVKDNQLFEGYGELNDDGSKFIDSSKIKYSSSMPLSKTDCD